MNNDFVSVLIPAYNSARWLGPCIESVLAQTWPNKEIIVVDDGSTDHTQNVVANYTPLVKLVKQEHQGACAARNHALRLSRGDYIQWMDADDILDPDKISRQLLGAPPGSESKILFSCQWGSFFACPQRAQFEETPLWASLGPAEWLYRKIDTGHWMAPETWLVSRHLTERAGPWNEQLARDQDGDYFCKVLMGASEVRFVSEARVFKRIGLSGSISAFATDSDEKMESTLTSIRNHVRAMLTLDDSRRSRDACLRLLNRWSVHFYPERQDLFRQLAEMAAEFGQPLGPPQLTGKYKLIQRAFGWRAAKRAKVLAPRLRNAVLMKWEQVFCAVSNSRGESK